MNIFKKQVEHDWKFRFKGYDDQNHEEYNMYQCEACLETKREYTGKIYESQKEENK